VAKHILQSEVGCRLAEAVRHGKRVAQKTLSDAALTGSADNAHATLMILDAIKVEGEVLITAMLPEYRLAIAAKVRARVAQAVLRQALEDYVEAASGWGGPNSGEDRGRLFDRDFPRQAEALRASLERKLRLERAMVAAGAVQMPFRWTKGGVIAALAVGAISVVVVLGQGIQQNGPAHGGTVQLAQRGR
jgi:hypothetical protein